jgi:CheY-like chemotaxis protein
MTINVLLLEDRKYTRQVVGEFLRLSLARYASEADDPDPDAVGGQLAHVLPCGWKPLKDRDFEVCCPGDRKIRKLLDASPKEDRDELRGIIGEMCAQAYAGKPPMPDVLVVDLALEDGEQNELIANDQPWLAYLDTMERARSEASEGKTEPERPTPDSIFDSRTTVNGMTGFKVLRALVGEVPMIATSYARHPLIARQCLVSGARAFVRKPIRENETTGDKDWDWAAAAKLDIRELERLGEQAIDPLATLVIEYLTTLTSQVLAALPVVALRQLGDYTRDSAPPWIPPFA